MGSVHALHALVRVVLAAVAVIFAAGCARGIVHSMEAVETAEVTVPAAETADVTVPVDAMTGSDASEPATCAATKNDEACFDCCDARYPNAIDIWFDALDACCPNDECADSDYEKCELAADDLCASDPECAGLEACEESSGCWEKVSSEP